MWVDGIDGLDYLSTYTVDHWVELLVNKVVRVTRWGGTDSAMWVARTSVSCINTTRRLSRQHLLLLNS